MEKVVYDEEKAIQKRALLLARMDDYIRENVDDEDVFEEWLAYGVPDGTEEYTWLAKDIGIFAGIVGCFLRLASSTEFTELLNGLFDDSDVIMKEGK